MQSAVWFSGRVPSLRPESAASEAGPGGAQLSGHWAISASGAPVDGGLHENLRFGLEESAGTVATSSGPDRRMCQRTDIQGHHRRKVTLATSEEPSAKSD